MPSTTSDHSHDFTYPALNNTNWNSTMVTLFQALSDDLDSIGTTEITLIDDTNANEMMSFSATASAVNYIQLANAATGTSPVFSAVGDDTNIGITFTPKGSGALVLDGLSWPTADGSASQYLQTNGSGTLSFAGIDIVTDTSPQLGADLDLNGFGIDDANGNEMVTFTVATSAVNYLTISNSATGNSVAVAANGSDATVNLQLSPKSSGSVLLGGKLDVNGNEIISSASGDLAIHSDNDVNLTLGDAAGANLLSIKDSAGVEVAHIDSDGGADLNSLALDIALPISEGGTGQTAATAAMDALAPTTTKGDIIVHNGTDNIRLAVGSNDQILIADSAEASGIKWAAQPDNNTWVALAKTDASSSSSVIFDSTYITSTYSIYVVALTGIRPTTDGVDIRFRTSTDNGSTFASGASDYDGQINGLSIDSAGLDLSSSSLSNVVGEEYDAIWYIHQPTNSSYKTRFMCSVGCHIDTGSALRGLDNGYGMRDAAEANNAIGFFPSSGTIAAGSFRLYGIKSPS